MAGARGLGAGTAGLLGLGLGRFCAALGAHLQIRLGEHLSFELTGVQKQSEAPLLNVRVERFVGRIFTSTELHNDVE